MKRIFPILVIFVLAACAAPTTPVISTQEKSTPTPALTPNPSPTRRGEFTPTPTEILPPSFSRAELNSMDEAQKIAQAPSVDEMPADLWSTEVQWSEPVVAEAGWGTIVQYSGADENGNEINAYYDLERGAWLKRYEDLSEVAKIPADKIPEALVVGDEILTSKVRVAYQWNVPPESVAQGWQVFRDASGNVQTVFDASANAWLSPEDAGMVFMPISNEERKDGKYIEYEVGDNFEAFMAQLIAAEKEALQSGKFVIPEKSKNYGWMDYKYKTSTITYIEPIFNVTDGGKPYALVSVGILDGGDVFGDKYKGRKFGLLSLVIKNPDGSIGLLHGAITKGNITGILDAIANGQRNIPSFNGEVIVLERFATNSFWYIEPLSKIQGGAIYKQAILEKMVEDGKGAIITKEMEETLFYGGFK